VRLVERIEILVLRVNTRGTVPIVRARLVTRIKLPAGGVPILSVKMFVTRTNSPTASGITVEWGPSRSDVVIHTVDNKVVVPRDVSLQPSRYSSHTSGLKRSR